MPPASQTEIRLRLVIDAPLPGVALSLQGKKGVVVDAQIPKDRKPLVFAFPVRIGPGPKFYGDFVRAEGPERRFVYIAVGTQAGQADAIWSRRIKVDIHTIPPALLTAAAKGKVLEAMIAGTGRDGTPACASVPLLRAWRAV
jgi:hypothetical protein